MTQKSIFQTQTIPQAILFKRMMIGAGIGLLIISVFLLMAPKGNPEWPEYWYIRALITVPYAGAMGGLFYYLMDHLRKQAGWKKIVANILSVFVFIIGLWMGTVLGLAGTMWN
ncbi:MAG: potassium transporter KefB [Pedobacter sp.]|nr:MAG: potassium transporter KefB [Pedobacter sp.]